MNPIETLYKLAYENVLAGGKPYSALIVLDHKIIASAVNESHRIPDPTLHAELLVIQKAARKLTAEELSRCHLYASGEPCNMCYTAAQYAGIHEISFVVSRDDLKKVSIELPTPGNISKEQVFDKSLLEIFKLWAGKD